MKLDSQLPTAITGSLQTWHHQLHENILCVTARTVYFCRFKLRILFVIIYWILVTIYSWQVEPKLRLSIIYIFSIPGTIVTTGRINLGEGSEWGHPSLITTAKEPLSNLINLKTLLCFSVCAQTHLLQFCYSVASRILMLHKVTMNKKGWFY